MLTTPIHQNGPDDAVLGFTLRFCKSQSDIASHFLALYLIGSRAHGTARQDSDHDFLVIVADTAPRSVRTGDEIWTRSILRDLEKTRNLVEIGPIDLLVKHLSDFDSSSNWPALAAKTYGLKIE